MYLYLDPDSTVCWKVSVDGMAKIDRKVDLKLAALAHAI